MTVRARRHLIIDDIIEEHAEEGAFLWSQRTSAVDDPRYSLRELADLDERVEAHIEGLRTAGDVGWRFAVKALKFGRAGEVFAAALLAFGGTDSGRIETVMAAGTATPANGRGLASALGWLPLERALGSIKSLLESPDPISIRIGLTAAVIQRSPHKTSLADAIGSDDAPLKARALRAAGELGVVDLQNALRANLKAKDPDCRYWAAWSTALLNGHKDAITYLQSLAETNAPFGSRAAQMVVRRLPMREARLWIRKLAKELGQSRVAIKAIGALGDPELIPWLIDQMKEPTLARVAGEAVAMITGAHISYDNLETQAPKNLAAQGDDADHDFEIDPDDNLPWPDPTLVLKWWNGRKGSISKDIRYLLGKPIDKESLRFALKNGYQRQRAGAAIELAILNPGRALFEVRAPGFRQQRLL